MNSTIYDIAVAFVEYGNISSICCDYIWLSQKVMSMHEEELLITRVGLLIICLYPAFAVSVSIARPVEFVEFAHIVLRNIYSIWAQNLEPLVIMIRSKYFSEFLQVFRACY